MEIRLCDHETDGSIRTVQQTGKLFSEILPETRETDRQIQKHAYNPSRNLSRPEPRKEKISAGTFRRKVREPKGWYIDKQVAPDNGGIRYGITEDGYEYIYYILVKEDP